MSLSSAAYKKCKKKRHHTRGIKGAGSIRNSVASIEMLSQGNGTHNEMQSGGDVWALAPAGQ